MFNRTRGFLSKIYYLRIRKMSDMDYRIMKMRNTGIKIGNHCRIFTDIHSNEPVMISIGDNVTISSDVHFCTHDNAIVKAIPGKTDIIGRIIVGDNCFIGMNSIIMYGVSLGSKCIVGAGSVVTHSFPDGMVIAGNPARAISTTEKYAEKYKNNAIDFSAIPFDKRNEFINDLPESLIIKREL